MDRHGHSCAIRSHHLPSPYVVVQHHLVPVSWQEQLYETVYMDKTVGLCPTHHYHAHLAIDAAVREICFNQKTVYDRRQFGRELWGWAEDAGLWLRQKLPADRAFEWETALPTNGGTL